MGNGGGTSSARALVCAKLFQLACFTVIHMQQQSNSHRFFKLFLLCSLQLGPGTIFTMKTDF